MAATLIVNEIYPALQGEGLRAGRPCALVRLTGCNLRCRWCDTRYAYEDGRAMTPEAVLEEVGRIGLPMVFVTGGEPLLQAGTPALLAALCDAGYEALVQTNGSIDVGGLDPRVVRCLDCKCPQSGAGESFCPANFGRLRAGDELKFILAGREDYEVTKGQVLYDGPDSPFLWRNPRHDPLVRDRSAFPIHFRTLATIHPTELKASILQAVRLSYGLRPEEVPSDALKSLGFERPTDQLRDIMNAYVRGLLDTGELILRGDMLKIA